MNTMLLLRHGKAERYNVEGDKQRNLTSRGVLDAQMVGAIIAASVGTVDLVISSDAARAAQTARLATEGAHFNGEIRWEPDIYAANLITLFDLVRSIDRKHERVLLVGHNPGFEELCSELTGAQNELITIPTCGLVRIDLSTSWSDAAYGTGDLVRSWFPKDQ